MEYYKQCQQNLGDIEFQKLISELTKKIIKKFGKEINVDQFVTILDINIKTIMLLSIAEAFPVKKDQITDIAQISTKYLVNNSLNNLNITFKHYILIIANSLKKKD